MGTQTKENDMDEFTEAELKKIMDSLDKSEAGKEAYNQILEIKEAGHDLDQEDMLDEDGLTIEDQEKRTQTHVYATLFLAGYPAAKQQQPGCKVIQYTGLTFVFFKDANNIYDNQTRLMIVKEYQEALDKKGIHLDLFGENPSDPYLCG